MKHLFLNLIVLFATTFAFAQVPVNGLVGWYPFSGNANDYSGYNKNGIVKGTTLTFDRFDNPNNAYFFDGKSYLDLGVYMNSISTFSVSGWFYQTDSTGNYDEILSKEFCFSFSINNWKKKFHVNFGNGITSNLQTWDKQPLESKTTINHKTWYNFVITRDVNTGVVNLYINGVLDATNISKTIGTNNYNTQIGSKFITQGVVEPYFNGIIDDIRIYDKVLNQLEIVNIYNENICYKTVSVADTLRISTLAGFNTLPQEFGTVKVFPNPTNDLLNISIDKPNSNYTIKIMDNTSKAVYTSTMNSNSLQVNLNQFSSKGLYLIQILDNTNKVLDVRKLILE